MALGVVTLVNILFKYMSYIQTSFATASYFNRRLE